MPSASACPAPSPLKGLTVASVPAAAIDGQYNMTSLFDKATRDAAVAVLVARAEKEGATFLRTSSFAESIAIALGDKKSPAAREAAAGVIIDVAKTPAIRALEPLFVDSGIYAALLEAFADKMPAVQKAAVEAVRTYAEKMNPWGAALVLPALLHEIQTAGKWQMKTGSLIVLNQLVKSAPTQVAKLTPDIVPILSEAIWDTKADVKKAARDTLTKTTALVSNKDIERFIPALINALINPVEEVPKTINLLSATTFVSEVDSPTLSLMVPLLARGLNEKPTATKRKVAVIVDNMAKLVDSAVTVRPFIPKLLPGLIKTESSIGDPEARTVVGRAIATLREVGDVPATSDGSDLGPIKQADAGHLGSILISIYKKANVEPLPSVAATEAVYAAHLAANMVNAKNFDTPEWATLAPYIGFLSQEPKPTTVTQEWVVKASSDDAEDDVTAEDEEEGEDLCNCQFSLAYGAKILLNTAVLRLKRGRRYGLCGKNGTGKSTLMRAIQNGYVTSYMYITYPSTHSHLVRSRASRRPTRSARSTSSTTSTAPRRRPLSSTSSPPTSVSRLRGRRSSRLLPPLASTTFGRVSPSDRSPVAGR
jgi:elongation factor 3